MEEWSTDVGTVKKQRSHKSTQRASTVFTVTKPCTYTHTHAYTNTRAYTHDYNVNYMGIAAQVMLLK